MILIASALDPEVDAIKDKYCNIPPWKLLLRSLRVDKSGVPNSANLPISAALMTFVDRFWTNFSENGSKTSHEILLQSDHDTFRPSQK